MIIDLTKLISWKDAPEWAMFAAFDSNGQLWWYEHEPGAMIFGWSSPYKNSRMEKAIFPKKLWTQTLQKRPDSVTKIALTKQLADEFRESWNRLTTDEQLTFQETYKEMFSE